MALMGLREYADHCGVSHVTILDKIKKGIISKEALVVSKDESEYKIHSDVADLEQEFYGDESRKMGHDLSGAEESKQKILIEGEMSTRLVEEDDRQTTLDKMREKAHEYRDAKIDTEQLKARKLQLEIAEREKELLPAEEVRRLTIKLVGETKDALLNIPGRIAHVLHGLKDPLEVEKKLYDEINDALGNLSRLEK